MQTRVILGKFCENNGNIFGKFSKLGWNLEEIIDNF